MYTYGHLCKINCHLKAGSSEKKMDFIRKNIVCFRHSDVIQRFSFAFKFVFFSLFFKIAHICRKKTKIRYVREMASHTYEYKHACVLHTFGMIIIRRKK